MPISPRMSLILVAAVSFCTLLLELLIARLSVFYLNYGNSFLAIPLTLLGLALGSLYLHSRRSALDRFDPARNLLALIFTSFAGLAFAFFLFSSYFPVERARIEGDRSLMYAKTLLFALSFIPIFFLQGKILTALFTRGREQIGRLYGADLVGAGLACMVTPFVFHFVDLPALILLYFLVLSLAWLSLVPKTDKRIVKAAGLGLLVITFSYFLNALESEVDISQLTEVPRGGSVTEIKHAWNEFSRVSLLETRDAAGRLVRHRIIHDNAESNVVVQPYLDQLPDKHREFLTYLPYLLNPEPKDVLVMFAGAGAQMIDYYHFNQGLGRIDGVEINPLVKKLALNPKLKDYRLAEFYKLPNVDLKIQEGRAFLEANPKRYDVIYVASDAATAAYKTGHSRKYLDTVEAMRQYFSMLRKDGLLIFQSKPSWPKMRILAQVLAEQGQQDFLESVLVLSNEPYSRDHVWHHSIIRKRPFTSAEIERITRHYAYMHLIYSPLRPNAVPEYHDFLKGNDKAAPHFYNLLPTDNQPYSRTLDFGQYRPIPTALHTQSPDAFWSWMKVHTLVLLTTITLAILAALMVVKRRRMPPTSMLLFLLLSGFSYMLCQVIFIGRLELFLGNPLYSMALLIGVFLIANGAGSNLVNTMHRRLGDDFIRWYPVATGVVTYLAFTLADIAATHLIGWPLIAKLFISTAIITPVGLMLGVFYPYAVTWLDRNEREEAVPVSYAISTLASVCGATYAMVMIINFGYAKILWHAEMGYLMLAVVCILSAATIRLASTKK